MYPATKNMDTISSGTGITYQATPAVGANGQIIMQLIPVRTVKENGDLALMMESECNPTLKRTATVSFTPKPVEVVTPDPCVTQFVRTQVSLGSVLPNKANFNLHNSKDKPSPQKQSLLEEVTLIETPAELCDMSEMDKSSPTLTDHSVEISPNKQLQRVPASELPPTIRKHVLTSSDDLVYVSTTQPVDDDVIPVESSVQSSLKQLPNKTPLLPSVRPKPSLKFIPHAPQRPNSPIRWMIEEEEVLAPPVLPSSGVADKILQNLAERERAHWSQDILNNTVSGDREEDALVLCNGEVFQKCSPTLQTGTSDSSTRSYVFTKTTLPPQKTPAGLSQSRRIYRFILPQRSNDVIDLCDDGHALRKYRQATSAVTVPEEDNVVFMSYTPPDSGSGAAEDLIQEGVNMNRVNSRDTREEKCTGMDLITGSVDDASTSDSSSMCSAVDINTWIIENFYHPAPVSLLKPASQHISDHLLRRMFGITADVKIILQRIDEASTGAPPVVLHHSKSTLTEVHYQKPTSKPHEEEEPSRQESEGCCELSVASVTPYRLLRPPTCSHFETETKPLPYSETKNPSDQSDAEEDMLMGYMEPIDEDLFSMDERHSPHKHGLRKRIRRTRKRTTCPCCVSGPQLLATKPSLKTNLPEKLAPPKKKVDANKTARKRGRPPGKISSLTAKGKKSESAEKGGAWSTSVDEIRRLRELLKEKEKALKRLKKNSSYSYFRHCSGKAFILKRTARKSAIGSETNVSADTSSTSPLPLGSVPQNYQVAVVIYQGRIYLSIRKPRRSQQQREAFDAPPASKSATPSASGTSAKSLKKRAAPQAPPKPAGKQPKRKRLRIPLPPGSLKLSLTKKNSTPNQKPLIGNRPERTPTQSKETQSEKKKDVTHNRREGSSSQAAPFVPTSADGAHKVDDQSQSHVTAEQTAEEAAGWVQEETNTSSERQSTGEGEAAATSNIHTNVQTDSRDHGSAGQSWTRRESQSGSSSLQQECDFKELEQEEKIAQIKAKLRTQEAALKNMPN
ncbi:ligand-dependent nuclear receptor-interacting factor 1 [Notolabrus celidotus]|uniref:ligand-dependent nuclear receptor-interacting factor 1 n=1 Tax=Notolabrus celidotus TaxID=1203425 RepID=UPI00148FA209|nr:ligand-dependent nuclear receptor-interacting factor 1 [Notolabrus celidotus]